MKLFNVIETLFHNECLTFQQFVKDLFRLTNKVKFKSIKIMLIFETLYTLCKSTDQTAFKNWLFCCKQTYQQYKTAEISTYLDL